MMWKKEDVIQTQTPRRHRASNMFLDGYKRNWIQTEGYSFEDRMIDDLSVSVPMMTIMAVVFKTQQSVKMCFHPFSQRSRKHWRKRRRKKRKRRQSQILFISSFFTLVAPPSLRRGKSPPQVTVM